MLYRRLGNFAVKIFSSVCAGATKIKHVKIEYTYMRYIAAPSSEREILERELFLLRKFPDLQ